MLVRLKTPSFIGGHLLSNMSWRKFYSAKKETHGYISLVDDSGKRIFISKTQQRMHLRVS